MNAFPATNTKLRPIIAFRAVRALSANPQDTRQIFLIFRALRGKSGLRAFSRFKASDVGASILAQKRSLLSVLEDRTGLAALPQFSVGRAYFDFMERESLSANGLVMASQDVFEEVSPEFDLFRKRMRDAHDLTHILTGYGRDPLGELCLLAFMNRHSRNLGQLLIIAMSWRRTSLAARKAVIQAWHHGRRARWFMDLDYEALLPRSLEEVRHELCIAAPSRYMSQECAR